MAAKGPKPGVVTIHMEKLEILVGKWFTPSCLGRYRKYGLRFEGMLFLVILVCSANLFTLCSSSYSLHITFYCYIFMHKIGFVKMVSTPGVHPMQLSFVANFSAFSLANSPPRDLQITAYK